MVEITKAEQNKEKIKRNEDGHRDFWGDIKCIKFKIIQFPE